MWDFCRGFTRLAHEGLKPASWAKRARRQRQFLGRGTGWRRPGFRVAASRRRRALVCEWRLPKLGLQSLGDLNPCFRRERASIVTAGLGIKPSIGGSTGEWTKAGRRFFAAGSEKPSRSAREIHILRRDQTRRAPGIFPTNFPTSKMGKKIWAYYIYISYLVV